MKESWGLTDTQEEPWCRPEHPQVNLRLWSCGTENREEYLGQSVKKAVENINTRLADAIIGENALNQAWIDHLLIETDGTENKSSAGANATLAVSLAAARAAAGALRLPFIRSHGCHTLAAPLPMMNILNGGKHADNTVDLQEFMIMPTGACCLERVSMCAEIYQYTETQLSGKKRIQQLEMKAALLRIFLIRMKHCS